MDKSHRTRKRATAQGLISLALAGVAFAQDLVALPVMLPKPNFIGTPSDLAETPRLEKALGKPRPVPQVPAGTVSEEMVGLWDILPTFAKLAMVSRPLGQVDGRSLVELLRHNQPLKERRIVWKSDDGSVLCVREKNWKAVRGEPKRFQLFDLSSDLAEENDVSAKRDDVLQRLIHSRETLHGHP